MSELPSLIVDVEARIDRLEKGLKKANAAQNRASGQMEARAKQSAERMRTTYGKSADGIAASFKRLGPALAASLSVAAIGTISKNMAAVIKDTAAIGDEAKRAGVSMKALQEWTYIGSQNRIGKDTIVDGLKAVSYTHLTLPTTPYV